MKIIGEEKFSFRDFIKNLNKQSKYFSDSFLIHIPIFLLLIKQILFYLMPLDVFLMNMCVVVLGLLVRREIKLRKARQIMKTQIFKEQYIPNVHAITLLLMLLLCLWLPLALRFLLIFQNLSQISEKCILIKLDLIYSQLITKLNHLVICRFCLYKVKRKTFFFILL